jgi:group I intron endonuclease
MRNNYCVYLHVKLSDKTPFYIGKGEIKRAKTNIGRSKWWYDTVNKHGYSVRILEDRLTEGEALELEIKYIKKYGRRDLGEGTLVNLTDGGEGTSGYKHTNTSKEEISNNNARGFLGRTHTNETKDKISKANKGNNNAKGNIKTIIGLKKISETSKGNTYMLGKTHSEESKNKISKSKKGQGNKIVHKLDLNGKLIETYPSLNLAAELNNTTVGMIGRVCRGIRKQHKGFKWSYFNKHFP